VTVWRAPAHRRANIQAAAKLKAVVPQGKKEPVPPGKNHQRGTVKAQRKARPKGINRSSRLERNWIGLVVSSMVVGYTNIDKEFP
jgi:hypothetical protein